MARQGFAFDWMARGQRASRSIGWPDNANLDKARALQEYLNGKFSEGLLWVMGRQRMQICQDSR